MEHLYLPQLALLYNDVDREAERVAAKNPWIACKPGCNSCCIDDLTLFTLEAENIRRFVKGTFHHEKPHRAGACAFLSDEGLCRIYEVRPYVCRTQGLLLRWFDDPSIPGSPEYRDVCALSTPPRPLGELPGEHFFTLGDWEGRLATLQVQANPTMARLPLRELFSRLANDEEVLR